MPVKISAHFWAPGPCNPQTQDSSFLGLGFQDSQPRSGVSSWEETEVTRVASTDEEEQQQQEESVFIASAFNEEDSQRDRAALV